jgi:hypothetical protein
MKCLGLHNKPTAEVHPGHKLTGPKEEEEEENIRIPYFHTYEKEREREREREGKYTANIQYNLVYSTLYCYFI